MQKKVVIFGLMVIFGTFSHHVLAGDYLAGQDIQSSPSLGQRLGESFFPGFRQPSDGNYTSQFVPDAQQTYVFSNSFNGDRDLANGHNIFDANRDVPEAPVSNVMKFRF